jgi:hypothetical protein
LIHNEIYEAALDSTLTYDELAFVKAGSRAVDDDQSVAGSYKHAMTPYTPGVPFEEARAIAEGQSAAWIDSNLDKAVDAQLAYEAEGPHNLWVGESQNSMDALQYFGAAAHTVSDSTSPEHVGFQLWFGADDALPLPPGPHTMLSLVHVAREHYDATHAKASQEEAVYEVRLLWAIYQAKLKAAREKKEKEEEQKRNQTGGCPSGKTGAIGMSATCDGVRK